MATVFGLSDIENAFYVVGLRDQADMERIKDYRGRKNDCFAQPVRATNAQVAKNENGELFLCFFSDPEEEVVHGCTVTTRYRYKVPLYKLVPFINLIKLHASFIDKYRNELDLEIAPREPDGIFTLRNSSPGEELGSQVHKILIEGSGKFLRGCESERSANELLEPAIQMLFTLA